MPGRGGTFHLGRVERAEGVSSAWAKPSGAEGDYPRGQSEGADPAVPSGPLEVGRAQLTEFAVPSVPKWSG